MDLSEEKELVRQAQKDPDAFAELYEHYYPKIFGYALRRTANLEAAQDITSETFFKALRKLWQFRWRNTSFSSWLYKIATNEINQYFRKAEYKKSISLEELQEQGFELISPHDPESELIEAQEKLKQYQDFQEIQKKSSGSLLNTRRSLLSDFLRKNRLKKSPKSWGKKKER